MGDGGAADGVGAACLTGSALLTGVGGRGVVWVGEEGLRLG